MTSARPLALALALALAPRFAGADTCGDGLEGETETCDLGEGNVAGRDCTSSCELPRCGDGLLAPGEACDDGNVLAGDGCSPQCTDEHAPAWLHTMDGGALVDEWFTDLAVVGETSFVLHHGSDAWRQWSSTVASYGPQGLLWEAPSGPADAARYDALAATARQLVLVGQERGTLGAWRGVVATRRLDGTPIGESFLGEIEGLTAVALDPQGDLFLGGTWRDEDRELWFGRYDLTADALQWSVTTERPGATESVSAVAYDAARGLYFTGSQGGDAFVTRLDPQTGDFTWFVPIDPPDQAQMVTAQALAMTDEQLVVVGYVGQTVTETYGLDTDGWIAAYGFDGTPRWSHLDAGSVPARDGYLDVLARDDGSVVAAGYRHHQALGAFVDWDMDAVLVEYGPDGARGRDLRYDGPMHLVDLFTALVETDDGFVVAGQSVSLYQADVGILGAFELPPPQPLEVRTPAKPPRVDAATDGRRSESPRSETLYVNFAGAALTQGDDGRREQITCADGPFDFPGLEADRAFVEAVMARVELLLSPFDVQVVWEAPPADALPYTTVLVGGEAAQLGMNAQAAGFSCEIDCGNAHDNELVFAFAEDGPDALANTIVHEAGHAWGLDHVLDESAVMSPFAGGVDAVLEDRCLDISDETSRPACVDAHAQFCPQGQQDAHAELMARLGARRADVEGPEIVGLPSEPIEVAPGRPIAFDLLLEDDGASAGLELRIEALGVRRVLDPSALSFDIYLPPGTWAAEFVALDHAGNETLEVVEVTVREAGSGSSGGEMMDEGDTMPETAGDTDEGPDDAELDAADQGCGCTSGSGPGGLAWVVLLLGAARARPGSSGRRSTAPKTRRRSARRDSRAAAARSSRPKPGCRSGST